MGVMKRLSSWSGDTRSRPKSSTRNTPPLALRCGGASYWRSAGAVDQVEEFERQFAADHDQRTADPDPALIDGSGLLAGDLDALVDVLVEQADHARRPR